MVEVLEISRLNTNYEHMKKDFLPETSHCPDGDTLMERTRLL